MKDISENKSIERQLKWIANNTVPLFGWYSLGILIIVIVGIFIWSLYGTVYVNIQGEGIILSQEGLFAIRTPVSGIVRTLYIKPGDLIEEGTLLAKVYDPHKETLQKRLKLKIEKLKEEVNRLRKQLEVETLAYKYSLQSQSHSIDFDIRTLYERLAFLEEQYRKKMKLYQEGLIVRNTVQETERQISETKVSIEEKKGELADIQFKLQKTYRTEELKTKEQELLKTQEEAAVVQTNLEQTKIYSNSAGKVLEVLVYSGETIQEGQVLVNAELISSENKFFFYGYFPAASGKHVHKGDRIRMSLTTVNKKEYGSILGNIIEVSKYAVSEQALMNLVHNEHLASFLTKHQPVIQVIAVPIEEPNNPSGYAWTAGKGPSIQLSTGAIGKVEVTIETIQPIYYVLPLKRFKHTSYDQSSNFYKNLRV